MVGRVTKLWLIIGAALLLMASQAAAASYSELFVQQATSGQLKKVGANYTLEITPSSSKTLGFTDRPGRRGRSLATTSFVSNWKTYGFKQDPPNAALSIDGAPKSRDLLLLTLKNPRLHKGRISYTATPLKDAPGYGLKQYEKRADKAGELKFGEASLFIDPTNQAAQVSLSITNTNPGAPSSLNITIDSDIDLIWSSSNPNPNTPGLAISVPPSQASVPFTQMSLNSRQLQIFSQGGSTPTSFTLNLLLLGSSDFLEATANIGPGWQVTATVNNQETTTWNSGVIAVPLD